MRILFLDFDGVLHPGDPEFDGEKFCWLPVLERLLIAHVDVRIVVHSSWRYDHTDAELKQLLGRLEQVLFSSFALCTAFCLLSPLAVSVLNLESSLLECLGRKHESFHET